MAIKFKAIKRGQPGVTGGGVKKFYASPIMDGELTLEDLSQGIEKRSTVSGIDIRAVLYALVDLSVESLAKGTIVRLGDLGSIRVSLSAEGVETEDGVTSATIKGASVIFTPGTRIKDILTSVKYQKG
jgi:predicted histone-like DNA-binding protein